MPVTLPEFWLHGTHPSTSGFSAWQLPPPIEIEKNHPELFPHRHIYLTDQLYWAKIVCDGSVICRAKIHPEAKILNVLEDCKGSEDLRQRVLKGMIGKHQMYAQRTST